jgi:alkyl hydroperoxide reductase subunit AhpF
LNYASKLEIIFVTMSLLPNIAIFKERIDRRQDGIVGMVDE